jgi:hypothetical protein
VRDEKLWSALGHSTIEEYAQRRLGLRRSALYQYLQIHDWLRDYHHAWLVRRPKGFIPELTDASALIWIEKKHRDRHLSDSLRAELEALRKKGMNGTLTDEEFRRLRQRGRRVVTPLRALLARLRSARGVAARIPEVPPAALAALDAAIRATERAVDSSSRVASLADFRRHKRFVLIAIAYESHVPEPANPLWERPGSESPGPGLGGFSGVRRR